MNQTPETRTFDILRPVGKLELFSTVRHNLGYYRCVAVTVKYRTEKSVQLLGSIIETAVAKVVLKHPTMRCGIINEDRNDPSFIRLESIDLSSCIKYSIPNLQNEQGGIVQTLEFQHRQLFPNIDSQPGWKVIIIPTRNLTNAKGAAFDVVFAFHHALADGISGMVFHRTMLEALNDSSPCLELSNHILKLPELVQLAPPVEKMVDFRISWMFFFKAIWNEFRPKWLFPDATPPWTGRDCLPEPIEKYESHVSLIVIPSDLVNPILTACRNENATFTGLLHGLVLASLASNLPNAQSFSSATPYSLRQLTGLSPKDEMGTQVSGLSIKYSSEAVSRLRTRLNSPHLMYEVWDIARNFRKDMSAELARLPNDNLIGMLPYVSDIHKMFKSRLGKPRSDTYEISNVGMIANTQADAWWKVERAIFSQSGMGTGPGMSFNVASVAGGPLTISVTWLEGDMGTALMDQITNDLDYALKLLGEGKDINIGL